MRIRLCDQLAIALVLVCASGSAFSQVLPKDFQGTLLVGSAKELLYEETDLAEPDAPAQQAWPLASISKQVMSVLAMQLVDEGKLSLDEPVTRHLPSFKGPHGAKITLRDLMRHTSGLPNPENSEMREGVSSFYLRAGSMKKAKDWAMRFCEGDTATVPGGDSIYNNCDTWVLSAVIESATGKSVDKLIEQRIARPAKLDTLRFMGPVALRRFGTTRLNIATYGPGGAMTATPGDIWRFDQHLMRGSLVSNESRATLWQGDPARGYVALGAWAFEASLQGCDKPVRLIERRGAIGHVQLRNIIAPDVDRVVIMATQSEAVDFGEIWQGRGISYDVLSRAICGRLPTQ